MFISGLYHRHRDRFLPEGLLCSMNRMARINVGPSYNTIRPGERAGHESLSVIETARIHLEGPQ